MELMRISDAFEVNGDFVVTGRLSVPHIKTQAQARHLFGGSVRLIGAQGGATKVEVKDVAFSWARDGLIQASVAIALPAAWLVNSPEAIIEILIDGALEEAESKAT